MVLILKSKKLAINGSLPTSKEHFPTWPFFDHDEISFMSNVL